MKRKSLLKVGVLLALMFGSLQCFADVVIIVQPIDDGAPIENALENVAKITFGADAMTIVTASGSVDVPYDNIQSIKFGEGTSALTTLVNDKGSLKVRYADDMLHIIGADGPVDVAIFGLKGNAVMSGQKCAAKAIDVSRLSSGVYIAKVNNVVVKFVKR